MLTKKIFVASMVLGLLIISAEGVGIAWQTKRHRPITLTKLEQQCRKQIDSDGFGNVTIGSANIQNQKGNLSSPCKVHLKPGSTLQLSNVQLLTNNLLIDNWQPSKKPDRQRPSHIIFNKVSLAGAEAGFQIQLNASSSTVAIKNSQIDYSKSVGVSVGSGDKDSKSSIDLSNSKITSKGNDSEGILFVSTGQATFTDNHFELSDPLDFALLMGASCIIKDNNNANDRCQVPQ